VTSSQHSTSDPSTDPGVTTDSEGGTESADEIVEAADSSLPHPPATATEERDEGVVSETDDGPEQGTSPGAG